MKNYEYMYLAVVFVIICFYASPSDASTPLGKFNLRDSAVSFEPSDGDIQAIGEKDGKDHPCSRPCDGKRKKCFYHFQLEWYQSMSKACYDCPFNLEDCERTDCVVATGQSRQITTINRKIPGPTIEVCQNDIVVVNLTNDLGGADTTIHWHGMHQRTTPYMDGVPFITQCPIMSETTFTYEFTAAQAGTQFWHAHIGLQRGDGVSGALIVRKPKIREVYKRLYDYDLSDHLIQIADWNDVPSQNVYTVHYHSKGSMSATKLLVNGRGRFEVKNKDGKTAMTRAPRFNVKKNKKYRFRVINEGFSFCPVELSVDGHTFTIIATDGYYVQPFVARALVTYAGERFDFIINADKEVKNYWIKFRGVLNCEKRVGVRQVAVLHYEGADDEDPKEPLKWEPRVFDSMLVNAESQGEEQTITTPISKLRYLKSAFPDDTLKPVPDHKFYIAFDLYTIENNIFNKPPYYGHKQVSKDFSAATPQLNHISMKLPSSPLLVSKPPADSLCDETSFKKDECKATFCRCHHVLSVKLNSIVEVILIDEGVFTEANHPFHLHGHSFRVIAQKRLGNHTTGDYVKQLDKDGEIQINLKDNPPYKDTVAVPDGGYTIIRFKASNPGYWFFHCHIEFHADVGMALAFKVGEHEDMLPVPQGFPTCGDFGNNGEGPFTNVGGINTSINKPPVLGNVPFNLLSPQKQQNTNLSNVYASVAQQYNTYHSVLQMPMGGQMEIVYRPPPTGT